MRCTQKDKCEFIEKIGSSMPNTKNFVKAIYCVDRERCMKEELAKTIIEHLIEGNFPENK
jgi:hypothetical protein